MPLREDKCFLRDNFKINDKDLDEILSQSISGTTGSELLYAGYSDIANKIRKKYYINEINLPVDNFFRLSNQYGFEENNRILTVGLRSSRFAQIIFWEIFHILAVDGIWVDIDYTGNCKGTPLSDKDYLDRDYYTKSLICNREHKAKNYISRTYRKTKPSLISSEIQDEGWSFGILTAGQSANAEKMARSILALHCQKTEIIICGAMPKNVPDDKRIIHIDLERPEPRGWISKKKNMIADAAKYSNLCIMHDRFIIPKNFLEAMERYGKVFSFLTFPQLFFPDSSRTFAQRYADYQVLFQQSNIKETFSHKIYDSEKVLYPKYNDYYETAFCCGGVYVSKKSLWNLIRQDESLYLCEWEDILFGLESQNKGLPHRVNPFACFESLNGHPLALTWVYKAISPDRKISPVFHISDNQKRMKSVSPRNFKPLINKNRLYYYKSISDMYNKIHGISGGHLIGENDYLQCERLSDFWEMIYAHIVLLPFKKRDAIMEVYSLLSSFVYNYPNCIIQKWIRDTEHEIIGKAEDLHVRNQKIIPCLFMKKIKVIISSCIKNIYKRLNNLLIVNTTPQYLPFVNIVNYFKEVEKYYPVIFKDSNIVSDDNTRRISTEIKRKMLHSFTHSDMAQQTIFVEHSGEILPEVDLYSKHVIES